MSVPISCEISRIVGSASVWVRITGLKTVDRHMAQVVIPANAGIHAACTWIPACAGMTYRKFVENDISNLQNESLPDRPGLIRFCGMLLRLRRASERDPWISVSVGAIVDLLAWPPCSGVSPCVCSRPRAILEQRGRFRVRGVPDSREMFNRKDRSDDDPHHILSRHHAPGMLEGASLRGMRQHIPLYVRNRAGSAR